MTGKPPTTLDRLWDDIPTGPAPIDTLLAAGHAAKRRSARARVVATVAATAVVLGGGFALVQGVPDRLSNLMPSSDDDLDVQVDIGVPPKVEDLFNGSVSGAAAIWNAEDTTVIYVSEYGYSGSCPPEGTATITNSGALTLKIDGYSGGGDCTADANPVTVVIDGLTTTPTDLTVTALGKTTTVPVAGEPDDAELPGEPPTEADLIGQWELLPGQTQPEDWMSPELDQILFEASPDDWIGWSGSDGCNQIGGRLTLQEEEGLTAQVTSATEVGCPDEMPTSGVSIILDASQVLLEGKRLTFYDDANEPLGMLVRTGDGSTGQPETLSEAMIAAEGIRAHLGALFDYHQSNITEIWVNESLCETEPVAGRDNRCRPWTTDEQEELKQRLANLGAVSFVPTRAGLESPARVAYAWAVQVDQTAETTFSVHVAGNDGKHAYWGDQPDNQRPCGWQIWTVELQGDNLTATLNTPVRTC